VNADGFPQAKVKCGEEFYLGTAASGRSAKRSEASLPKAQVCLVIQSMHQLINGWLLMNRRVDAHLARTQFGQIMNRAVENNERFVVERRGEPAVVIMSVQDFIRTAAPPPDWLEKAWNGAKRRAVDKLSPPDIDAEISTYRHEKRK
jgi:prevent-host-death family protein